MLRKEAEKYSEVRSRLATLEGLQAAALFQQGLKQHPPLMQSPTPAGLGLRAYSIAAYQRLTLTSVVQAAKCVLVVALSCFAICGSLPDASVQKRQLPETD